MIQFLAQWNGYEADAIHSLDSAEESRLVAAGLARYFRAGIDGTSTSGAVFVPAGLTYGHVMDAITKLQATGKAGTIQFESELYDFSSAGQGLPWLDGVSYQGVHPHVRPGVGQGAIDDVAATFQGGTVLLGNGTFEGISANRTPRGAPDATRADATVTGACIRDIGMENFSTALAAGALNEYGIGLLEISNVYIINPDGCRSFDFQTSAHVYMRTVKSLSLIHIYEPTRPVALSSIPYSS